MPPPPYPPPLSIQIEQYAEIPTTTRKRQFVKNVGGFVSRTWQSAVKFTTLLTRMSAEKLIILHSKTKRYLQEESPLYKAFIATGITALVLSFVASMFLSSSIWGVIAFSGLLQLSFAIKMKAKLN